MTAHIKNLAQLDTTPLRHVALEILQSALDTIDTERIMRSSITLSDNILRIRDATYNLSQFKCVRVIGFGKAACRAAMALESILGNRITEGAVIGLEQMHYNRIVSYVGTHPVPSTQNIQATEHIVKLAEKSEKDDLVIVIVSGGGSSLLVWPESEFEQSRQLYEAYIKSGGTILQLNTLRKHLSLVKGGGLAKMIYPATVVGLIFSDVPGNHDDMVASGPTFIDTTTIIDARKVADKLNLGTYKFIETPKDKRYFSAVRNITLVSNTDALNSMAETAQKHGLETVIISSELYDFAPQALERLFAAARPHTAIIAGGEVSMKTRPDGNGGRNLFMSALALQRVTDNQAFISLASDGLDNSDVAGALVDTVTIQRMNELSINPEPYIKRTNSYRLFEQIDNVVITGPTGANVSDLYILLTE